MNKREKKQGVKRAEGGSGTKERSRGCEAETPIKEAEVIMGVSENSVKRRMLLR